MIDKMQEFLIFDYMKKIDYEALTEELLEHYPTEDNPEIYSLYTSMLNHLMKCFKLKHSTAVKLLLKVEEKLGIHLVRNREMTNMKLLNLKKNDDVKRYFRCIYWYNKLSVETVDTIIHKYNNISASLVKKFLRENGEMSESKYNEFTYAKQYYLEHRAELLEKKREYRAKIKRLNNDKR